VTIMKDQKKEYTIQEVSDKIGRSIYTIGRWQKEGFVTPEYRQVGGKMIRYFTAEDIEKLEEVKKIKQNIMLSGTGEGGIE
jgi:DNA-binding transcriptional MerR regulator